MAKHEDLIASAAKKKVQILGPGAFRWPRFAQSSRPAGTNRPSRAEWPHDRAHEKPAKQHQMVLVVLIYEVEMTGVYSYRRGDRRRRTRPGKHRKHHIRTVTRFWEKFHSRRGSWDSSFEKRATRARRRSCYDRHFQKAHASSNQSTPRSSTCDRRWTFPTSCWNWSKPLYARGQCLSDRRHQSRLHGKPLEISGQFHGKSSSP